MKKLEKVSKFKVRLGTSLKALFCTPRPYELFKI